MFLHVSRIGTQYVDVYEPKEGHKLAFQIDGDGDLLILGRAGGGKPYHVAGYARGQWAAVTPDTVKRQSRP